MKFPKDHLEEPRIIVIPIVDVLLTVFLFLAVLAFKNNFLSVFIQLPQGSGKENYIPMLNITVDRHGNIFLGKKKVSLNQLKEILKGKKTTAVNILADKRTPYGLVAKVLIALKEIKITNVNLIMEQKY